MVRRGSTVEARRMRRKKRERDLSGAIVVAEEERDR